MTLPVEFVTMDGLMTLGVMSALVFGIVQLTKDALKLEGWKVQVYAWAWSIVMLAVGTYIKGFSVETMYVAFANSVLVALVAVGIHELGDKTGFLRTKTDW